MDCTQARELIDARPAAPALAAHLAGCLDCRELAALLASLAALPEEQPPAEFEARLRARLSAADRRDVEAGVPLRC